MVISSTKARFQLPRAFPNRLTHLSMASNAHCAACTRGLRQQFRSKTPSSQTSHLKARYFSISSSIRSVQQDSKQSQPATTQRPPPPLKPLTTSSLESKESPNSSPPLNIAAEIRKRAKLTTETYIAYGACESLVKECARHADYTIPQAGKKGGGGIPKSKDGEDIGVGKGWWYEELGLTPTFNNWAQITFLHMYLLTVRIRAFPPTHAPTWHQHLLDHFFFMAEDRMVRLHSIHAKALRSKYLKDLFVQWRGLTAGYDEGLAKSNDAVLATAVWRNVFRADEDVDLRGIGMVVSYIRGVLKGLEAMGDEGIAGAEVVFAGPGLERAGVLLQSSMMRAAAGEIRAGTSTASEKVIENPGSQMGK